MVDIAHGYYTERFGVVRHYYLGGEPPDEQYIFLDGAWRELPDGYFVMDKLIDGDGPDGPMQDPPEGVPAFEAAKVQLHPYWLKPESWERSYWVSKYGTRYPKRFPQTKIN